MQHLLALGHRRIALIDPRADPLAFQDPGERQAGYRQALVVTGLPLRPAYEGEPLAPASESRGPTGETALLPAELSVRATTGPR